MTLTAEQKMANKDKRLARDRAYRARYREWRSALEAVLAPFPLRREDQNPEVAPHQLVQAAWAIDASFEAAKKTAEQEEQIIRAQIAQLQESLKGVRERHNLISLAEARRNAYATLSAARTAAERTVNAEYSDVASVSSAAAWGVRISFDSTTDSAPKSE